MPDYVALLRGVNVGGGNKVIMKDLCALCEGLGGRDVQTYLASGNLMFSHEGAPQALAADLRTEMRRKMGVDVPILVQPGAAIQAALLDCPYTPDDLRHVHVGFLFEKPALDVGMFEELKAPSESLEIGNGVVWVHTPDGYGRSKLGAKLVQVVGADLTARNLRSVAALSEMLDARAGRC